jgi:hypothetical protein
LSAWYRCAGVGFADLLPKFAPGYGQTFITRSLAVKPIALETEPPREVSSASLPEGAAARFKKPPN